jgi:hypothetical protein
VNLHAATSSAAIEQRDHDDSREGINEEEGNSDDVSVVADTLC